MKKIELLAPAGSREALEAAVESGADAVYLAGNQYGARAFAANFDDAAIVEAIRYCHQKDVKVYITMNTLLAEDQIDPAVQKAGYYYENDVDGLLVQDLGLMKRLRVEYPDLPLHCSTQMHIHNLDGVRFAEKMGMERVVLARETPIELIRELCKQNIEIEVFAYGALCVSYSGQCLMSSALMNRSGNKGTCAQCCRLPYTLRDKDGHKVDTNGDYVLSPKDLNVINHIPELVEAGVTCLKIEGRMKRREYVAMVVRTFREAIDAYYSGRKYHLSEKRLKELKLLFNREFTEGLIFHQDGKDYYNRLRPNHMGIVIGEVISADKERFTVKLDEVLHQGDGIRILNDKEDTGLTVNFLYKKGLLVNKGEPGDIVQIKCSDYVKKGAKVLKTSDVVQLEEINRVLAEEPKRITLQAKLSAKVNEPVCLQVSDGERMFMLNSEFICEAARKEVNVDQIVERLCKTGDTHYDLQFTDVSVEQVFIPVSVLNQLRRDALEQINEKRAIRYKRNGHQEYHCEVPKHEHKDQLWINSQYDLSAYGKMLNKEYQMTPVVNENSVYPEGKLLVSECGGLMHGTSGIGMATLNASNSYALELLFELGLEGVVLSSELTDIQVERLVASYEKRHGYKPNVARYVYGRRRLMFIRSDLLHGHKGEGYVLEDQAHHKMPVTRENGVNIILEPTALVREKIADVTSFVSFWEENEVQCKSILEELL